MFSLVASSTSKNVFVSSCPGSPAHCLAPPEGEDSLLFLPGFVLLPAAGGTGGRRGASAAGARALCLQRGDGRAGGRCFFHSCPLPCQWEQVGGNSRRWCPRVLLGLQCHLPGAGSAIQSQGEAWLEVKNTTLGTATSFQCLKIENFSFMVLSPD